MLEFYPTTVIYYHAARPEPPQLMSTKSEPSRGGLRTTLCSSLLLIFVLLLAPSSSAQIMTVTNIFVTPSTPTASDVVDVRVRIMAPACGFFPLTVVNGNTIRTTIGVQGCVIGPPGLFPSNVFTQFGPVPAGVYTYEVYSQYETDPAEFVTQTQIVIADSHQPIPALEPWALAMFVIILAGLGLLLLRRY